MNLIFSFYFFYTIFYCTSIIASNNDNDNKKLHINRNTNFRQLIGIIGSTFNVFKQRNEFAKDPTINILSNSNERFINWLSLAKLYHPESSFATKFSPMYHEIYEIGQKFNTLFIINNKYIESNEELNELNLNCLTDKNIKDIHKDMPRTISNIITDEFTSHTGQYKDFELKLNRIFQYYICLDKRFCLKDIGYAQGMNYVVGNLLIALNNDEPKTLFIFLILLNDYKLNDYYHLDRTILSSKITDEFQNIIKYHFIDVKKFNIRFWYTFDIWFGTLFMKYSQNYVPDIKHRINILYNFFQYGYKAIYAIGFLYFKEKLTLNNIDFCNKNHPESDYLNNNDPKDSDNDFDIDLEEKQMCYIKFLLNNKLTKEEQEKIFSNEFIDKAIHIINKPIPIFTKLENKKVQKNQPSTTNNIKNYMLNLFNYGSKEVKN